MMPYVKENQRTHRVISECQLVRVLDAIQPWIRKHISGNAAGEMLFDVAHARAQFDGQAKSMAQDSGGDVSIELRVHFAERRFSFPMLPVLMNFYIVLIQVYFWHSSPGPRRFGF